jgi:exosortase B
LIVGTRLHGRIEVAARRPFWLLVVVLLFVTYVPTYVVLAKTVWQSEDGSYGPLILVAVLYVFWTKRHRLADSTSSSACAVGAILLAAGLFCYVVGRSQGIIGLDTASQLPVIAGVALILGGWLSMRALLFPVLFLFFAVPLPGVLVVAMTEALKVFASSAAAQSLWTLGYPVAQTGVVLVIGPYRLLVADACSGLHSLISLAALGLLYLHLSGTPGRIRALLVAAAILPIALAANVIRIIVLALITYYFGDEAGQSFLHELAGLIVFAAALLLFVSFDRLLARAWRPDSGEATP